MRGTTKFAHVLLGFSSILYIANAASSSSNEASRLWLDQKAQTQGVTSLPSGVLYKKQQTGKGKFHPTDFSYCVIHFRTMFMNETEFVSTYDTNSSYTFRFTDGLDCWQQVLPYMVEGDLWEIYSPSDLCHGEMSFPHSLIPPGDAVLFQLELLKITAEKSPAQRCNLETLEGCDEGEKGLITKFGKDTEKILKEMKRVTTLVEETLMKDEIRDAMAAKVSFLQRLLKRTSSSVNEL
jgi:hypothetical protein